MSFELRCHRCSMSLGTASLIVQLVGLFKASAFPTVKQQYVDEIRRRCRSCGWVNVFHPSHPRRIDALEMKQST